MPAIMSDSTFNALRAAIHIAHADGHISAAEEEALAHFLNRQDMTESQRGQLLQDLASGGPSLLELLPKITERADVVHLINISRIVTARDGTVTPEESAALQLLLDKHMPTVDLAGAREAAQAKQQAFTAAEAEADDRGNWLQRFINDMAGWL